MPRVVPVPPPVFVLVPPLCVGALSLPMLVPVPPPLRGLDGVEPLLGDDEPPLLDDEPPPPEYGFGVGWLDWYGRDAEGAAPTLAGPR